MLEDRVLGHQTEETNKGGTQRVTAFTTSDVLLFSIDGFTEQELEVLQHVSRTANNMVIAL